MTVESAILPTLYYAHDPMCSWCWGFRPVWQQVQQALAGRVKVRYLLGGLAPDTSDTMPEGMQINIRDTWRTIQKEIPCTEFNFDFWRDCQPRRSTYPACRAIIACRMQSPELESAMLLAIQQAYYLHARNPSDNETLLVLALEIGLDGEIFLEDTRSDLCQKLLMDEIHYCREIGASSFPSIILKQSGLYTTIDIDYNDRDMIIRQIL